MDALHVASAIYAHADYFLTTDKALLRKMKQDPRIKVLDPIDFVRIDTEELDENGHRNPQRRQEPFVRINKQLPKLKFHKD